MSGRPVASCGPGRTRTRAVTPYAKIIVVSRRPLALVGAVLTVGGVAACSWNSSRTATTTPVTTAASQTTTTTAPALTSADLGLVAANIACQDIDVAGRYWVNVVVIHGVDAGVIKQDATHRSINDFERTQISEAHVELAEAATDDPRWVNLQQIMTSTESAAVAGWDRGGLSANQAVLQAVGTQEDTVHGICAAAKTQLTASAQSRHETADVLLSSAGATPTQVHNWDTWSSSP